MKKYFIVLSSIIFFFLYWYISITKWSPPLVWNIWYLTLGVRFAFPFLVFLAIVLSRTLYPAKKNLLFLCLWRWQIIVWGIVTIYEAVMNISFYYIVPSILIAVMLCDMLARAILAGLFYLFSFCNRWATIVCWLMKDLSIQKEYYYILFLLLFLTVAVLSSI